MLLLASGSDDKKKESSEYGACFDRHMPPAIRNQALATLKLATDPEHLEHMATLADKQNFPLFANCLREKAQELRES